MPKDSSPAVLPPGVVVNPAHSPLDNAQGLFFGVAMVSFGIALLHAMGLLTGQAAGIAFLIAQATGADLGLVFLLVNVPFYVLAVLRMDRRFVLRSIVCVAGISLLTSLAPRLLVIAYVEPFSGAILAGLCIGIGVIGLFRHGASGGGIGILAYYIQEKTGFRAGWLQLLLDVVIFAVAAFMIDGMNVLVSMVGALALNLLVAFNHRRDWYVAR
ncbi:YitT family protein [Zavarzinia compransoris]|uniref:YitT family protein n=1 Tax=Zavarzinia compransoris TaxID=1264899 RepID=A0A317E6E5_9PROT|nr:YitT family protein [Zavarzinia compransoris]PWR21810.1 YitT family protein [Zavarzinia compransoris]TDP45390.1 putative 5xTM membrane YitT family protein [Zavarzinia compransoris]